MNQKHPTLYINDVGCFFTFIIKFSLYNEFNILFFISYFSIANRIYLFNYKKCFSRNNAAPSSLLSNSVSYCVSAFI